MAGAKLRFRSADEVANNDFSKAKTFTCDDKGEVTVDANVKRDKLYYYASTDTDKASNELNSSYSYYFFGNGNKVEPVLKMFTDRSIYRPGQTVQVSAIAFDKGRDG